MILILFAVLLAYLQSPQLAFEAATIKPNNSPIGSSSVSFRPGRYTAINTTLGRQIIRAFGIKEYQLSGGPDWMDSAAYDIVAKAEGTPSQDQIRLMLQALLLHEFQLKFHWETKEVAVYALVAGKEGSRLKAAADRSQSMIAKSAAGQINGRNASLSELAVLLSREVDRPVLEQTGITGTFDFTLDFAPEGTTPGATAAELSAPSIFTAAMEQLGLKLEQRKSPMEMLVIDSASRPPQY